MAGADERLTPATRNYVIFGLLLIVALALAARDRFGPHQGRGQSDSALRLMIVGSSAGTAAALDEVDGFSIMQIGQAEVIALGREFVDDDDPAYLAALAYADQNGYGFIALALPPHADDDPGWGLDLDDPGIDALPPESVRFVVFSVGDLAPQGPRMRFVELADIDYEPPLAEVESIRLAIYEHPDLLALWHNDLPAHVQAKQVLGNRGLLERRVAFKEDQDRWLELTQLWPATGVIAGSLAAPWEQVRAAPIRGGVLVEVRAVRPTLSAFRRPRLALADTVSLWFVPFVALHQGTHDPDNAAQLLTRLRCFGLPAMLSADSSEISVAPDGSSLVLRETPTSAAQVFVFDEQAAREGNCLAQLGATLPAGERAVGRPNAAGRMAWHYDDDWLHWFGQGSQQREQVHEIDAFSGPWWVDNTLLAMVASRPFGPPDYGFEQVVTLLDTNPKTAADDGSFARLDLDVAALFPGLDPATDAATLLDLRPAGEHELLVLSERCDDDPAEARRPCLHRLRSAARLAELVSAGQLPSAEQAAPSPPYEVETLGPIGPYVALAIAAQGGRLVWVDGESRIMSADLRGPQRLVAQRLDDDDALPDATPRISAEGRIVLSQVPVSLAELGSVSIARVFVLPHPPRVDASPSPGEQQPPPG